MDVLWILGPGINKAFYVVSKKILTSHIFSHIFIKFALCVFSELFGKNSARHICETGLKLRQGRFTVLYTAGIL